MRLTAKIALVALAGGLVAAALGPWAASAESDKDEAGVILSNMPQKGSPQYKQLSDLAGATTGRDLDMTHAEMWSVPRARLDAFIAAAKAQGVQVKQLDESWNRLATPMSKGAKMSAKQKQMMTKSMESKAAMGMSMMELPDAATMEYALTKGMNAPDQGTPQVLLIPLNDKVTVSAKRTGVTKTDDGYIWRGVIDDSGEPVTLLWWPGGRLAGTITHGGHMYVIKNLGGDMHGMIEMDPDKMPPEHGAASKKMMRKMKMRVDPLVHQGEAMMMKPGEHHGSLLPTTPEKQAGAPKDATINLIVAYTKKATSHYDDVVKDLIDVAIAEANQSFRDSGIDNVRVKLVHAYETDYAEKGSHFDHVYRFRDKGDGYMDEIHGLRDKHGADVAALVVDDPMGCGLSIRVGADAADAFTAVNHECAATMYSLAHEIGHLIGARHDRALDDTPRPFPYGHGFVNGKQWRTMMSYKDSCDGCPRRPVWSGPDVKVDGTPAGDAETDNAKVVREGAARVASFRPERTSASAR
ncbi:MAG TPA: M12 family metallo-peptidase [Hyphomicrobium sp.]